MERVDVNDRCRWKRRNQSERGFIWLTKKKKDPCVGSVNERGSFGQEEDDPCVGSIEYTKKDPCVRFKVNKQKKNSGCVPMPA